MEFPTASLPSEAEPTIGDGGTAVATATEPAEPFCSQRASRIFHRTDCAWVKRIPDLERVYFKHVAEAREQALMTCPVCEPWESV